MPTPEGYPDDYQWVEVQLPEGKGPGETFEHLNHNGRYTIKVTVPDDMPTGTDILLVEGNKRRRSAREMQKRAETQAVTVERATAKRTAAELAADARATAKRATDERAAARRAAAERANAEAKRLTAEITA